MSGCQQYAAGWYENVQRSAGRSARAVLPMVIDIVRPRSVVDVGCGTGAWLNVFAELGVGDVMGVDGPMVPSHLLTISEQQFRVVDLAHDELALGRTFDLSVSLEVAEHLPAERAAPLVRFLVGLAPVVVFGAAIPSQGGTRHLNEQWPDYWAELFAAHDYVLLDVLRSRLWDDARVEYWYAQNTFLYVRRDRLSALSLDAATVTEGSAFPLRAVHPALLDAWVAENRALAAYMKPFSRRLAERLPRRLGARLPRSVQSD